MKLVTALMATLALFAGCDDFASPAELSRPQILGIQADPASVAPGMETELRILVANSSGPVENAQVAWTIEPPVPGAEIAIRTEGVFFKAPDSPEELPTLITVEARTTVDDSELLAVKGILVGGPILQNPEILAVEEKGAALEELRISKGQEIELQMQFATELSEDASFAWYARPGEIKEYRSNPTTIVIPEDSDSSSVEGWLFAVVRDGGGIDFFQLPIRVE